mmetsp:Transcript_22296/g.50949  ORF Transcript_22296/g.50949 Transcript_22296/m.50949 type:complete len:341 (-) Transcript_22296:79-1101(-)
MPPSTSTNGGHAAQAVLVDGFHFVDASGGEDLAQRELPAALHGYGRVHLLAHLAPDELHQLPLREAGRVVDVGVHLADLVPVATGHLPLPLCLPARIPVRVQLELEVELMQPRLAVGDAATVEHRAQNLDVVPAELVDPDKHAMVEEGALRVPHQEETTLQAEVQVRVSRWWASREGVPDNAPGFFGAAEHGVAIKLGKHRSHFDFLGRLGDILDDVWLHSLADSRPDVLSADFQAVQQAHRRFGSLLPVLQVVRVADNDLRIARHAAPVRLAELGHPVAWVVDDFADRVGIGRFPLLLLLLAGLPVLEVQRLPPCRRASGHPRGHGLQACRLIRLGPGV